MAGAGWGLSIKRKTRACNASSRSSSCRTISPRDFQRRRQSIVYPIRNGETDNLWLQNLDGSPGKQLTDFKSEFIRDFDFSFDGKQLAIIRGHREADVVLIRQSEK